MVQATGDIRQTDAAVSYGSWPTAVMLRRSQTLSLPFATACSFHALTRIFTGLSRNEMVAQALVTWLPRRLASHL